MNFINSISIGDRLEICSKSKDKKNDVHISQIENIIDRDRIVVHVPITYLNKKGLIKDIQYEVLIFTVSGIISFMAIIESYIKEDGFNLMIIKFLTKGKKIQRRGFFRFSCFIPFKFQILENKEEDNFNENNESDIENIEENNKVSVSDNEENIYYGILVDLSGGGIRFYSNEEIENKIQIKCDFKLYDDLLVVVGEIIQRDNIYNPEYRYQYRVVFTGILPKEQEKIIKFIFNEQRRILHRIEGK